MKFYALKYGLNASGGQVEVMQALKSAGAEVIQTSDGLCVKTDHELASVEELVKAKGASGITVRELDVAEMLRAEDTPADVKKFMQ